MIDNLGMTGLWNKLIELKPDKELSVVEFWNGLRVWIQRPHLVNRKLLATEQLSCTLLFNDCEELCLNFNEKDFQQFISSFENNYSNESFSNIGSKIANSYDSVIENCTNKMIDTSDVPVLLIRKLIPRNLTKFSEVLELVLIDENLNVVIFWPKESDVSNSAITPSFPYRIRFQNNCISIETYRKSSEIDIKEQISEEWLKSSVLPKIIKWCKTSSTPSIVPSSLSLVSPKSYSIIYNSLKEKYARMYVEIWPENTDPLKYVYEDIAIAAYLITLWEKEMEDKNLTSKQTFVDLGCGNGLLVDLLASEGYTGIGIDVRKRKIWDLYGENTTLIERTIEPSDYNLFPDYDWIIGNHSDELTPWIPVIAARSSYKMKVFLLPCCAFTFNGKYEPHSSGKTNYQSYLSFVHNVCENMGFNVKEDRLRIPSTKRVCFVCTSRNYSEGDEEDVDLKRNDFIKSNSRKNDFKSCNSKDNCTNFTVTEGSVSISENIAKEANWIRDFKPRDRVEVVKNCSQLDRKFLDTLLLTVANVLLKTENYISLERGSETILWNAGGKMKLSELISKIDSDTLKGLKNQCGGFQTFLRNHRNVFQIVNDDVQLNIPVKGIPLNSRPVHKKKHRKTEYNFQGKPCFFFFHHPQGCPLEAADCNFSHKIS